MMNFAADTWWLFGLIISGAIAIISFFLKRTINEADRHDKSISKLQTDVEQIKDTCLTKKDYYNSINEVKDEIKTQNKLILELLRGGKNND